MAGIFSRIFRPAAPAARTEPRLIREPEARSTTPGIPIGDPAIASLFGGLANTIPRIAVTPDNALRFPAVSAPIRLVSGAVSVMPLELFTRLPNGGRERADGLPLFDLVHTRPNAWQSSARWRRMMTATMLAWGNAYARIVNPAAPTALEPLHPRSTFPFRDSQGRVWYRHHPRRGGQVTLAAAEVLHLRYGEALDDEDLEAVSPIVAHRETIALAMATTEYLARFFANSAAPRGVLEAAGPMSKEVAQQTRHDWEERYQGLDNAHRIAVLPQGLQYKPVGMSHTDAQILELYRQVCSDIAHKIYGIPPHLTGDTEKSSSWGTGIEQQGIGMVQYVLQPILEEWEQSLDGTLLTTRQRRDMFFEMNVDGLMRGDFKSRMDGYALAIQWGLMAPNEVRRLMNLAPVTGGDSRLQPLNMAPAERIMDVLLRDTTKATRSLEEINGGKVLPFAGPSA
jgi:HK97 family phage portal protein